VCFVAGREYEHVDRPHEQRHFGNLIEEADAPVHSKLKCHGGIRAAFYRTCYDKEEIGNLPQRVKHSIQVLSWGSNITHEERDGDIGGKTEVLAVRFSRMELLRVHAVPNDFNVLLWDSHMYKLANQRSSDGDNSFGSNEGTLLPTSVQDGIEALI
jgi:hypothetical protein